MAYNLVRPRSRYPSLIEAATNRVARETSCLGYLSEAATLYYNEPCPYLTKVGEECPSTQFRRRSNLLKVLSSYRCTYLGMMPDFYRPSHLATSAPSATTRIIIHGGAGNITRTSIPRDLYDSYHASLTHVITQSSALLSLPGASALDIATYAVSLLENDPLYNSGHGAVFTRAGQNELECSIMVTNGYKKRGVSCTLLKHVKNPIKLARELLIRGEEVDGGGAGDHCQFSGEFVEGLAKDWDLEIVNPDYFFTQKRWDEHLRGLDVSKDVGIEKTEQEKRSDWESDNYIPLGTCGAVVVDSYGTICTVTSTGGLTNKVPGRIGDTPTLGAGFWAEEWWEERRAKSARLQMLYQPTKFQTPKIDKLSRGELGSLLSECLPSLGTSTAPEPQPRPIEKPVLTRHAVAISGTGNGDSFLRLCAARTTAAYSRFTHTSLSSATMWMAGPGGELQKSAGDRWDRVHEGVGGMIGIELVGDKAHIVQDFNGGGMFRAWMEEDGSIQCRVFKGDDWESGPKDSRGL